MSRQRSTWSQPSGSRQAATTRQADIYTMNQERVQPSPVEYQNGDPDSWAETPVSNKHVEMEYDGDHVRRNEVGFPEFREDTWKHKDSDNWGGSGKYDNQKLSATRAAAAKSKAEKVERIARAMLRTDDDDAVGKQMIDLMSMPDRLVVATLGRIQAASHESLPSEKKLARAHACCKLAARLLPGLGNEANGPVEKLARTFASIDDPTLKSIVLQVAAGLKLAKDEEEDDGPEKNAAATAIESEGKDMVPPPEKKESATAIESEMKEAPAAPPAEAAACGGPMGAADMAELDALLHQETGMPGPSPELTNLFAPAAPAAPMMAPAPSPLASTRPASSVEIQFGDDDEMDIGDARVSAEASAELDNLFSDHPEVQAQREIQAAERAAALGLPPPGYGGYVQPGARTASSHGAKRIGQVQAAAGNPSDDLANLWR